MTVYNSIIARGDAEALIKEQVSTEILKSVSETSAVLRMGRKLADMPNGVTRMPVLATLPLAYFITGDNGKKQTTKLAWENRYLDAEEVAVIVPIPKAVLDDLSFDIIGQSKPAIAAAFGKVIDDAVLYGTGIPSTWTTDMGAAGLIAGITAKSHLASIASYADTYEAILGETGSGDAGLFGMVEEDGYLVTGSLASPRAKRLLRNCRDKNLQPIFNITPQGKAPYTLDGTPCDFPTNGAIDPTYHLISGDWNQLVYAMRQDLQFDIATEATIIDGNNEVVFSLFQQDMVALRCTMRLAVALPKPVTLMDSGTGFPFAALTD
jgi:hypothetical protein